MWVILKSIQGEECFKGEKADSFDHHDQWQGQRWWKLYKRQQKRKERQKDNFNQANKKVQLIEKEGESKGEKRRKNLWTKPIEKPIAFSTFWLNCAQTTAAIYLTSFRLDWMDSFSPPLLFPSALPSPNDDDDANLRSGFKLDLLTPSNSHLAFRASNRLDTCLLLHLLLLLLCPTQLPSEFWTCFHHHHHDDHLVPSAFDCFWIFFYLRVNFKNRWSEWSSWWANDGAGRLLTLFHLISIYISRWWA